jgi:hypothetical protein
VKPHIHLTFQLSTHRLSQRKTARCPPRLVFRINVPLGSSDKLRISPLPFTLTWTKDFVYISKGHTNLEVIRVPLFRNHKGSSTSHAECHVREKEIFLPASAISKKVYYFPPDGSTKGKNLATVIVSSRAPPSAGKEPVLKYQRPQPIGLYVDEQKQLGG